MTADTPAAILAAVAAAYGITVEALTRPGRRARPAEAEPRHLAAWLLRQRWPNLPEAAVGRHLGMRDHTSARYAIAQAAQQIAQSPVFRRRAHALLAAVAGHGLRHRAVPHSAAAVDLSTRRGPAVAAAGPRPEDSRPQYPRDRTAAQP